MCSASSECALVEAAIGGDNQAVEQLLLLYYDPLERHIKSKLPAGARRHFGTEDILQLTFSQVYRDIARFQTRGQGSFFAWLKMIADHRLIDALRKNRPKGAAAQLSARKLTSDGSLCDLLDLLGHDSRSPSKDARRRERGQAVQVAIASLPEDQRSVLWRHYIEGQALSDIAHDLERSDGAVRGLLHRGKEGLRKALGRQSHWLSG